MVRKRYKGISKLKRDAWVRQMAEDMPQLTQAEIGQRFGLDQSAVSRILKQKKRESQRTIYLKRRERK